MIWRRSSGVDALGLRRAMSDRMLALLVAAMAFLAALALGGWIGSAGLAAHWRQGAGRSLTVQVPAPADPAEHGGGARLAAVTALLSGAPGIASVHVLSETELTDLLKPWLGEGVGKLAIQVPAVIAVELSGDRIDLAPLAARLDKEAPGTLVEDQGAWADRLTVLARSLQALAGMAFVLVAGVAVAVIAIATRAGLSLRREAIEIVHGLGATDSFIIGRFATRATALAGAGGAIGALVALPVLLTLARLAAPFGGGATGLDSGGTLLSGLPASVWLALPMLPLGAAAIGFCTARNAVHRWLRRLP